MNYILSIDQSTSCTKALLFDQNGQLCGREDTPHRQIINDKGWVEHDPREIYRNLLQSVQRLLKNNSIKSRDIRAAAISNQRETSIAWNRETGEPVYNAIVWQCTRGASICDRIARADSSNADMVKQRSGLKLSPYFSAAKLAWILESVPEAAGLASRKKLCCSTIDSWLVNRLTKEHAVKTDYSNACRTQLFNIHSLAWDTDLCNLFSLSPDMLPEVCFSDSMFGMTDFDGILDVPVPLHGVLGDSHAALFAQGCLDRGMVKATYGTGSSVMMNIGSEPVPSNELVVSLAWALNGKIDYVLEGNINYSGATISWLQNDLNLIADAKESGSLAERASRVPGLYFVPAFTGLGAPYWSDTARALVCGMDRTTGKAEFVRAAEEAIAYQIADIVLLMKKQTGLPLNTLRVDGGPTKDRYLMQFQSDILDTEVRVASVEELSGMGAAFASGMGAGFYDRAMVNRQTGKVAYKSKMQDNQRIQLYSGWKRAVECALSY